jgi:glutathione S-transferase
VTNTPNSHIQPPYITEISPNGRVPAITDPNTNITLWESGAINQYLVETYDKNHSISYTTSPEKHLCNQWLHFQVSGQGPYYGQGVWFQRYHSEKIPSAVERYVNEVERVIGVLDTHLKKQGTGYLVGDKCTYADLAFVTWHVLIPYITGEERKIDIEGKYPEYDAWMKRMCAREAVEKAMADRAKAMAS